MTRGEYDVNNDNRVESAPPDYQDNQLKQRKNGDVLHDDTNKVESIEIPSKEKPYVGYGFKEEQDQSLWLRFKLPLLGTLRFNPIVSFASIALIWVFVGICIYYGEKVPFVAWKSYIVAKFTWLYIGSQDLWAVFALILYFSKYSNLKLGKPDDKPEYNDVTWFVMLFACGIGVGLFFYGVAEPIFHYTGKNRYTADPTMPDNTLAQIAINVTLYHWGIHGWIVYCLVGLLLALMTYRENLPMTMKSCFYPLIGDKIFGWMGDAIDTISVLTTLFGVCTSLGLGTRQLNTGFHVFNSDIDPDDITIQIIIIWVITAIATVSTVSGVGMGIRRLSETCFGFGMFLMMVALFMDKTFYILNLMVQSLGYYLQYIVQLGWHTDAFEQLGPSAHEKLGRFVVENEQPDGPSDWMDDWTMFYWGWWISWSPFVGMFIAKISKGRTIKQFINGTLTAPVLYSIFWMVIFGGAGIRHEREASNMGLCCNNEANGNWFLNTSETMSMISDRNVNDSIVAAVGSEWLCKDGQCGDCAISALTIKETESKTYTDFLTEYKDLGKDFGSTTADRSLSKLSCHPTEQMWFDVMRSYSGIGQFLGIFSLFAIVLYFVTSSDSGSLVIDCLTSNGDPDPPKIQRVFWAVMEGATASALLAAGGKGGLQALQTAGIVSGLPYTFVICILCVALWRAVKVAAGDLDPFGPSFAIGLFDCFATHPMKQLRKEGRRILDLFIGFLKNIILAPWTVAEAAARLNNSTKVWAYAIAPTIFFTLFIIMHFAELAVDGCWAIGWCFYLGFVTVLTSVRIQCRDRFNINGNAFEDFFASLFFYPNVALQLDETTKNIAIKRTPKTDIKMEDAENGKVNKAFEN